MRAAIVQVCSDDDLAGNLTRAEAGCISFEVTKTSDPMVWAVSERFVDAAAFEAHQARAAASDWAAQTAGIARDYTIRGME